MVTVIAIEEPLPLDFLSPTFLIIATLFVDSVKVEHDVGVRTFTVGRYLFAIFCNTPKIPGTSRPWKGNMSLVGSSIVDSSLGAEGVYKNGKPVSLYG